MNKMLLWLGSVFLAFLLAQCNSDNAKEKLLNHAMGIFPTGIEFERYPAPVDIFYEGGSLDFFLIQNNEWKVLDVLTGAKINSGSIPQGFRNFHDVQIINSNSFILFYHDQIAVWTSEGYQFYSTDTIIPSDMLALNYFRKIVVKERESVIIPVMNTVNNSGKFLLEFNYKTGISKLLDFQYPKSIKEGKKGVQKLWLTSFGSNVVVSFSLSDSIWILNLENNNISSRIATNSTVNVDLNYPDSLTKAEKRDLILYYSKHKDQFYKTFVNGESIYRLVKKGLPENSKEKDSRLSGMEILHRENGSNITEIHRLVNGQYFTQNNWVFNQESKQFGYLKWFEKSHGKGYEIYIYTVDLLDF